MNMTLNRTDVIQGIDRRRRSFLAWYESLLRDSAPTRRLGLFMHEQLDRVQYDPVNPYNRTVENPFGQADEKQKAIDSAILEDRTIHDKIEAFFKVRPVSTSLLAFFVIATAAASAKHSPSKILVAAAIILAVIPLLTSRRKDLGENRMPDLTKFALIESSSATPSQS